MSFFCCLVAELAGVEADVLEHVAQLRDVGVFDGVQGLVDALAVARLDARRMKRIESSRLGGSTKRSLFSSSSMRPGSASPYCLLVVVVVVLPDIGDVLQEQHRQDVVLVDARIDGAAKGVAGGPDGRVDAVLADGRLASCSPCGLLVFSCGGGQLFGDGFEQALVVAHEPVLQLSLAMGEPHQLDDALLIGLGRNADRQALPARAGAGSTGWNPPPCAAVPVGRAAD